jgi:hypothetical protein
MDLAKLRDTAPRPFAIVQDTPDDDADLVVSGWGLQLVDRAIFAWCESDTGHRASVGVFTSADSALWMVEMAGPARLVWMHPIEPGAQRAPQIEPDPPQ